MDISDKFKELGEREHKTYKLPPDVEQLRDKIIDRFKDEPLSEIADFVQRVLKTEKNEVNRLAALAARVYLIRHYVNRISGDTNAKQNSPQVTNDAENIVEFEPQKVDADNNAFPASGLRRVRIIEDSTVNGIFFPAGVTVDVQAADALRLTKANKVLYVSPKTGEIIPEGEDPEAEYVDKTINPSETEKNHQDDADSTPLEDENISDVTEVSEEAEEAEESE